MRTIKNYRENPYQILTIWHRSSFHAIDDYVIAIVADGGHGADAAKTENGSGAGVKLTEERSKDPDTSAKAVEEEHGELCNHHAKIGNGQVDDKQVGGSFQILGFQKKMKNQRVAWNWQIERTTRLITVWNTITIRNLVTCDWGDTQEKVGYSLFEYIKHANCYVFNHLNVMWMKNNSPIDSATLDSLEETFSSGDESFPAYLLERCPW